MPHQRAHDEPERVHAGERLPLPQGGLLVPVQVAPLVRVDVADDVQDETGDEVGQTGHEPHALGKRGKQVLEALMEAGLGGSGAVS